MTDVTITSTVNEAGEAVFTGTIAIPAGIDPEWAAQFVERALRFELREILRVAFEAEEESV
jgi:hypothetical protein